MGVDPFTPDSDEPLLIAELRATTGLTLPDCCVLATARALSAPLITFDDKLHRAAREQAIAIIEPIDWLADSLYDGGMTGPILFIGDSITDAGRRDDAPDFLGDGYVRMIAARLPDRSVINAGISGNRAVDLRDRWHIDVVERQPHVLTVYVGINDTWRRYDSNDPTTAAAFESDYRACLGDLGGASTLILVEPFVLPVTGEQQRWHEDLDEKRAVVGRLATEFAAQFLPLQALLSAAAEDHGAAALAQDGVHPTALGHRLIADAWLELAGL